MMSTIVTLILVVSFFGVVYTAYWLVNERYRHHKRIKKLFEITEAASLIRQMDNTAKENFQIKLARASLTQKDFNEILFASILAGAAIISLIYILELSQLYNILLVMLGVGIMFGAPFLYIDEQSKARTARIERDLAVFLDLVIIILEGGGGLNNAIDRVASDATKVIGHDLIEEFKIFKYEYVTYGNEVATKNIAIRTGSPVVETLAGFLRLSEETGIGVKTIFENQAQEIRQAEMLGIEKKAATMNINITFTMFIFILPAIIAMIAFPMAANVLMPGF